MRKVVIVTGGASGIGRAVVEHLATQSEFFVYSLDRHQCFEDSSKISNIEMDLGDIDKVRSFFSGLDEKGSIYGIVANAGIHQVLDEADESSVFRKLIDFNVCLTYDFILAALPLLQTSQHEKRHVVLTSSASSLKGLASNPGYAASKAAIDSLVRSLALKYAPNRIYFNSVNPGWVETLMFEESLEKYGDLTGKTREALTQAFIDQGITGKIAQATEVAELIAFILSGRQSSIVGQNLVIDNGYMLK